MRSIKVVLIFCLLFKITFLKAQGSGRLVVKVNDEWPNIDFQKEKICLKLYLNDTLCGTKFVNDLSTIYFKNLRSGKYELSVFRNDIEEITYHKIDVDTSYGSSQIELHFKDFRYGSKYIKDDDTLNAEVYIHENNKHPYQSGNILKGVPLDNKPSAIDAEFQFSYTFGFYLFHRKYFDIPFEFGFNSGFAHIKADTTFFVTKPKNTERNFYLNSSFALLNSIHLFHDSLSKKSRCTIQYGIAYNFPFIYNHVGVDSSSKYVQRSISNYTNVYLIGRIMFGKDTRFGVQAEYNLNPYIKKGFAEPAIFRAGLVFKAG